MIDIKMFGKNFGIYNDGERILLRSKKAEYILYYLILNFKRKIFVSEILREFFDGYDESYSRKNLNTLLYMIRRGLNITKNDLRIEKNLVFLELSKLNCDYVQFQRLLEKKNSSKNKEQLLKLYTGELLEGLNEEWVLPFRELCEMQVLVLTQELNKENLETAESFIELPSKNEISMDLAMKMIVINKKRRNPMFYPFVIRTSIDIKNNIRKSDFYVKLSKNTYLVLFEVGSLTQEDLEKILKDRFNNNVEIIDKL